MRTAQRSIGAPRWRAIALYAASATADVAEPQGVSSCGNDRMAHGPTLTDQACS